MIDITVACSRLMRRLMRQSHEMLIAQLLKHSYKRNDGALFILLISAIFELHSTAFVSGV